MASVLNDPTGLDAMAETIWDLDFGQLGTAYQDCREGTKRHLRREAKSIIDRALGREE